MSNAVTLQVGTGRKPPADKNRVDAKTSRELDKMLESLRKEMDSTDKKTSPNLFDGVATPTGVTNNRGTPNACDRYEQVGFQVIQAVVCSVRDAGHDALQKVLRRALENTTIDPGAVAPAPVYTANARDECGRRALRPWAPFPRDVYKKYCDLQREISTRREALARYMKRFESVAQQSRANRGVIHNVIPTLLNMLRHKIALVEQSLNVRRDAHRENQKARKSVLVNLMLTVTEVLQAFEQDARNIVLQYREYLGQIEAAHAARRDSSQNQYERRLESAVREFGAWLRSLKGVLPSTIVLSSEASEYLLEADQDLNDCGVSRLRSMLAHVERVKGALDMMSDPSTANDETKTGTSNTANNSNTANTAREAKAREAKADHARITADLESVRRDMRTLEAHRVKYWSDSGVRKSLDGLREVEEEQRALEQRQTELLSQLEVVRKRLAGVKADARKNAERARSASARHARIQAEDWDRRIRDLQTQAAREAQTHTANPVHALRAGLRDETVRTLAELYAQAVSKIDGAGLVMAQSVSRAVRDRVASARSALRTLETENTTTEASLSVYEQRISLDAVASPLLQKYRATEEEWRLMADESMCMQLMSETAKACEKNIQEFEEWAKGLV